MNSSGVNALSPQVEVPKPRQVRNEVLPDRHVQFAPDTYPGATAIRIPLSSSRIGFTQTGPAQIPFRSAINTPTAAANITTAANTATANTTAAVAGPVEQGTALSLESANFLSDRLGTLVSQAVEMLGRMSFADLCLQHRGTSCLTGHTFRRHPAEPILSQLRDHGAPVRLGSAPWTLELLDAAVRRGSHSSTHSSIPFVRDEFADMVSAGQWIVFPYSAVRLLPNLRLSPTGLVPQRDRRDRLIVDYSFSDVNQSTLSEAPDSLQFGFALSRILQKLQRADTRRGAIYLAKIDVADAFMRIPLSVQDIAALGALLPVLPGEEPLVAFPLILPMGWVDSPQYLCAVTETVADMANELFRRDMLSHTPHRLDILADTRPAPILSVHSASSSIPPPPVRSLGPKQEALNTVDVYMDDFILLSQLSKEQRTAARRTVFECIDSVLRPLSPTDNPNRKEPNSVKKLAKGDAAWSTRKVVLGWLIDTRRRTIELPPHRLDRLHILLSEFSRSQRRTSRRKWQRLIGELRSMILAIPGGRGMFSQLQSVLTYDPNPSPSDRLHLTTAVHDQLDDFRWLAGDLSNRPTRWGELVDSDPSFFGTVDASGVGMGGVWLDATGTRDPLLWRLQFDVATSSRLVSSDNPTGTLTNSDLEQTGTVCHQDILVQNYDVRELTICALTDNTAALSRELRGSTSVDEPSSYLCRISALHQRAFRYRLRLSYIPGPLNVMADDLSRRWDLDDSQLLLHFHSHYPQDRPWRLCHLRPKMSSSVLSALSMKRCKPEFLVDATLPPPPTNAVGPSSVNNMTWNPSSAAAPIQSRGCKSSLKEYEAEGFPPAVTVSDLARWRMPSTSLHRRTPSWVNVTPDSPPEPPPLMYDWLNN